MAYGAADVSPDVIREGAIVCLAGADPFAELCVAGGDARLETARALEVRDDFGVQEMFDGGEEFVVGGSVLHGSCLLSAIRYQLSVLRGRRDSSLLATNEGLGAG